MTASGGGQGRGRFRRTGPWSASEVQRLRELLGTVPVGTIARLLRRSPAAVASKIATLGKPIRGGTWRPEEDRLLKRLYGTRDDDALATLLARTPMSVRIRAKTLGLAKDKTYLRRRFGRGVHRMPRWAPEEEKRLRVLYPSASNLEIARVLGRSVKSVLSKAHDLHLRKSPRRLAEMGRANVAVRYEGILPAQPRRPSRPT